jgi:hypothetical protein
MQRIAAGTWTHFRATVSPSVASRLPPTRPLSPARASHHDGMPAAKESTLIVNLHCGLPAHLSVRPFQRVLSLVSRLVRLSPERGSEIKRLPERARVMKAPAIAKRKSLGHGCMCWRSAGSGERSGHAGLTSSCRLVAAGRVRSVCFAPTRLRAAPAQGRSAAQA